MSTITPPAVKSMNKKASTRTVLKKILRYKLFGAGLM
jgi:hypothetical protein